jgi:hypothetical protein
MSILALESTRYIPVIASYDWSLKKNISIGNTWSLHSPMDHDRCNFMHLLLKNHAFPSRCGQSSAIVTPIRWKSEGPALPLTDDAPPGQSQHRSLKLENPSAFPREVLSSQLVCDPFPCPLAFLEKKAEWATSSQP